MLFLSWSMSPAPVNRILRFDHCIELDILINKMKLFMVLKCLEVFLLSEEDQKISGTNPSCHSGLRKVYSTKQLQQTEEKEEREKKFAF